jgi:streptogramin lyase
MNNVRMTLFAVILLALAAAVTAYAQAPLSNTMPASAVLGQTDLVTRTTGFTASTMNNAFGVAVDPTTGKLFVADRNNNRVLRFSSAAKLVTGGAAEVALGQPRLDTNGVNTGGLSATTMNTPIRLFVDGAGRLWVSDYGNRRVLRFDNASTKSTGAPADGVLGQPDFVTNTAGTTASKMNRTTGVFVDKGGRLWVAERDNNRVLRFDNAAAKANGAAADGVLGQPDFVTSTSGVSASVMSGPFGVYVDAAGRLWVAEDGNNRALRFDNAAAKANGAAADGVLGQPNFTANTYSTTQSATGNVRGVWGDGQGRIYLVDEGNSRIMVFNNAATLANGANADNVLGQPDFTSSSAPVPPTASSLSFPNSMYVDNTSNQIWVADAGNNRVLRFDVQVGAVTGVRETFAGQLPSQFALSQNYPNPFNPGTKITFALKRTEFATVTVYNLLGQGVATLFEGTAAAGQQYVLTFNAANLPSGVYFYTLRSAGLNETRKMMLMK